MSLSGIATNKHTDRGKGRLVHEPILLLWAALALMGVAACWVWADGARHSTGGWNETIGQVTDVRSESEGQSGTDYDTTIRFEDTDGIVYEFESEYGYSKSRVGHGVDVKYPAYDPASAKTSADVAQEVEYALVVMAAFGLLSLWLVARAFGWRGPRQRTPAPADNWHWPPHSD